MKWIEMGLRVITESMSVKERRSEGKNEGMRKGAVVDDESK